MSKKTVIYDGKLTAWLWSEIDHILEPILPPVGKLYEGKNSIEVQSKDPRYNATRDKIVALARDYAARERSDDYENPVTVEGEVDHGFCD